ncbi:hypothetical protein HID58_018502, partial [Brassica napus]
KKKIETTLPPRGFAVKEVTVRVKHLAKTQIRQVKHTILSSGAVTPGVFAEILELLQGTVTQHLSEKQKQPIDLTLPLSNERLDGLVTATKVAPHRVWVSPKRGSSFSHEPLAHEDVLYLGELLPQICLHCTSPVMVVICFDSRFSRLCIVPRLFVAHGYGGGIVSSLRLRLDCDL